MQPASPLTLRVALAAALVVFFLAVCRRLRGWKVPHPLLHSLAAFTLLPVVWRFFEFRGISPRPDFGPALAVTPVIAPLVAVGCAAVSLVLRARHPVLASAIPMLALAVLFVLKRAAAAASQGIPDDPVLWLFTATIVLLACLGLVLARPPAAAGSTIA